jgi:hypothetical protein
MRVMTDEYETIAGKTQSALIKTCPSATLGTTNPTWISLGLNTFPLTLLVLNTFL